MTRDGITHDPSATDALFTIIPQRGFAGATRDDPQVLALPATGTLRL